MSVLWNVWFYKLHGPLALDFSILGIPVKYTVVFASHVQQDSFKKKKGTIRYLAGYNKVFIY